MKKQNPANTKPPVSEADATTKPPVSEAMPSTSPVDKTAPTVTAPPADTAKVSDAVAVADVPRHEDPVADSTTSSTPSSTDVPGDAPTAERGADGAEVKSDSPSADAPAEDAAASLEQPPEEPPEPPEPPEMVAPKPKPSRAPMVIALLALVGVALIGWQVWELRLIAKETRQEVAQRLSTGDGAVSEIRALTRQQQEATAALQARFGALQSQVEETEGQATALEALYMEYSRSRSDQALAEVEQAINIGAQQLHLAGNYEAALIALQGAEARLAMPDQGHLQALRRALIKDIETLKAHPQVDVSGLALRLEILLERVDSLPLAFEVMLAKAAAAREEVAAAQAVSGDGQLGRALEFVRALSVDVWSEVRGMMRLERMDQSDPVLLAPAQSTYLRENIKIRLLTARLALLARDGKTYSTDLSRARGWVERYFDVNDEQVQRVLADLAELEQVPIKGETPALTDTFAALRLVQSRTGASRPAESPTNNGSR